MVIQGKPAALVDNGIVQEEAANAGGIMRADITDRNGELLATTIKTASLYADPHLISDSQKAAENLARIFPDLEYGETLRRFQKGGRFVHLKYSLTPQEQHEVLKLGEPGLAFKYEDRRVYPQGALISHFVGYAGTGMEPIQSQRR